jgi:hypothetical protein
MVVKRRSVGKNDMSRILLIKIVFKSTTSEMEILKARSTSRSHEGIGIMKKKHSCQHISHDCQIHGRNSKLFKCLIHLSLLSL